MSPEEHRRVVQIFHAVADLTTPEEREARLAGLCGEDTDARRHVEAMLLADGAGDGALHHPVADIAADALASLPVPLQTTIDLDEYRITRQLGAGGMGEVFLAEDTRLNRNTALKVLAREFVRDPDRLRRFEREARIISALNHPNIVTIYRFGHADGVPVLATEYVDGVTLRQMIDDGPVAPDVVLDIARQVCSALGAAHAAGIVHRDIKPENIMRRADGVVKVLDFGIAKLVDASSTGSGHTTVADAIVGTPAYMAPEQARGMTIDTRSDVFSLGVVLHELLSGRAPFVGATAADVLAAVLQSEPRPLPDAPPALASIVSRCLRKEPKARYQDAAALLADLNATGAIAPEVWFRSRRALVAAAAIALVTFGAGVLALAVGNRPAPAVARSIAPDPSQPPGTRSVSPRADDLLKLGQYLMAQRNVDASNQAVEYLRQAVTLKPDSAITQATLALALRDQDTWAGLGPGTSAVAAREAARRAIALDANLPAAHLALARVANDYEWNWIEAEREFARTLALAPDLAEAHMGLAQVFETLARPEEAVKAARTAALLEPLSPRVLSDVGRTLYRARHYREAVTQFQRALTLDREYVPAVVRLQDTYDQLNDRDGMRAMIDRMVAAGPRMIPWALDFSRARYAAHLGRREQLVETALRIERSATGQGEIAFVLASLYADVDRSRALHWLERGIRERSMFPLQLRDPILDPLRQEPAFRDLLRETHMP